jgi:hypothetical protein
LFEHFVAAEYPEAKHNLQGFYWSSTIISTVNGIKSYGLAITSTNAQVTDKYRGDGFGVRCIKN